MTAELVALIGNCIVGHVSQRARGRLAFTYDQAWRASPDAYPISLSMPLAAAEHGPDAVEAFLWGLLPDNEIVLDRWARKFQISPRNVFAMISHVGEDCAGAVQFVTAERLDALRDGGEDHVDWLDEGGVAERLRALREDHAAWRLPRDTGQFSLAGAQPKTALLFSDGRWGIPSGRTPTTHILKPPTGQFDGHAENEHFCLQLARSLGMPTATSRVMRFGEEIAIVVERYDRVRIGDAIIRVHQEDTCQAFGIMPTRKYQNEGGPSAADIVEVLRTYSTTRDEDVQAFIDASAFNWIIAGTDAHAKNYSLLISGGGRVRLAPLYDVASILPYDDYDLHKMKLSMKIGGEYGLLDIGVRQWEKFAREMRIDGDALLQRILGMAEQLPDLIHEEMARLRASQLALPVIERLAERLIERSNACRKKLAREGHAS